MELEFASLPKLEEWLVMNRHDVGGDGIPTFLKEERSMNTLTEAGSLLPALVAEKKKIRIPIAPIGPSFYASLY